MKPLLQNPSIHYFWVTENDTFDWQLIKAICFRYDEDEGRVEPDYPRNMAMWKGVGYNIDSVFQWKDGKNTTVHSSAQLIFCDSLFDTNIWDIVITNQFKYCFFCRKNVLLQR